MTLKRIKLLGINLTGEGWELYAEKYKLLMEEVKETQTNGAIFCGHGLTDNIF